jgi:hypothetical protein
VQRDGHFVGFRPEHLLPAEVVPGDGNRLTVHFEVGRTEYLSGDRHAYGVVRELGEATRIIARLPATVTTPIEGGETYEFAVHERDLRFFDAETGQRTAPKPIRV